MQEIFPGMPERRDGYLYLNDKPGIGVDINEELAAAIRVKIPAYHGTGCWRVFRTALPFGPNTRFLIHRR